jgi:hypothetical protein
MCAATGELLEKFKKSDRCIHWTYWTFCEWWYFTFLSLFRKMNGSITDKDVLTNWNVFSLYLYLLSWWSNCLKNFPFVCLSLKTNDSTSTMRSMRWVRWILLLFSNKHWLLFLVCNNARVQSWEQLASSPWWHIHYNWFSLDKLLVSCWSCKVTQTFSFAEIRDAGGVAVLTTS